jgi:hypothetical protein
LYTLAHGQPLLTTLGIRDHLFDSKVIEFQRLLNSLFRLPTTVDKTKLDKSWSLIGIKTPMKRIPTIGEVFQGIHKRISVINDKLDKDDTGEFENVFNDEFELWIQIVRFYTKDVDKHFSPKLCHIFKMEDRQLPEVVDNIDVKTVAIVRRQAQTTAQQMSRPYYESMFKP